MQASRAKAICRTPSAAVCVRIHGRIRHVFLGLGGRGRGLAAGIQKAVKRLRHAAKSVRSRIHAWVYVHCFQ